MYKRHSLQVIYQITKFQRTVAKKKTDEDNNENERKFLSSP